MKIEEVNILFCKMIVKKIALGGYVNLFTSFTNIYIFLTIFTYKKKL